MDTPSLTQVVRKRWQVAPDPGDFRHVLARTLNISDIAARLLAQRLQNHTIPAAEEFLAPNLRNLHRPWLLATMEKAATRIAAAIKDREKIVIYGDYDSDGVTASALLIRMFRSLNYPVTYYLPDRVDEGYGISENFVRTAARDGVKLVITVDCGVSNLMEVSALQDHGVDVIVTDHHEPGGELPAAYAVINPKRAESQYPFRELTGVGVAFKLAWAVCEKLSGSPKVTPEMRRALLDILPYCAIGTITDVAPLLDENRLIAAYGLKALEETKHPGLRALLGISGLDRKTISPRDISFRLGPRLNAAGRMGKADLALQVLVEEEPAAAIAAAERLEQENTGRQELCRKIHDEALALVREQVDLAADAAIVVVGEGWHEGVIGIVAARLVEEFHRPSVVIALSPDGLRGKGSARGIPGLHLYNAMSRSRQRFESFGGHEMAAGFSLVRDQIAPFRKEINLECHRQMEHCRKTTDLEPTEPVIHIDMETHLHQIGDQVMCELSRMAPFGQGNPVPVFLTRHIKIAGRPQLVGKTGQGFSFFASQKQVAYRAVAFGHPEWMAEIDGGIEYWDLVYTLSFNDFYTPARIELRVNDMRPS